MVFNHPIFYKILGYKNLVGTTPSNFNYIIALEKNKWKTTFILKWSLFRGELLNCGSVTIRERTPSITTALKQSKKRNETTRAKLHENRRNHPRKDCKYMQYIPYMDPRGLRIGFDQKKSLNTKRLVSWFSLSGRAIIFFAGSSAASWRENMASKQQKRQLTKSHLATSLKISVVSFFWRRKFHL